MTIKTGGPPPADETGCNCTTHAEHAELVARVDASYVLDPSRARQRQERTSSELRRRIVEAS